MVFSSEIDILRTPYGDKVTKGREELPLKLSLKS